MHKSILVARFATRFAALLATNLVVVGCSNIPSNYSGFTCDQGDCVNGYTCDAASNTCITEGDACGDEGVQSSCSIEPSTQCDEGCRTCTDGTWTACISSAIPLCTDKDGDGVGDGTDGNVGCDGVKIDPDDGNSSRCGDTDGDSCDDCAIELRWSPNNDGVDGDGDGQCDMGDTCNDVDGDGVGDGTGNNASCATTSLIDTAPQDPRVCGDVDLDTCDDCSRVPWNPNNDGLDSDSDGVCDAAPTCPDKDGDGVGDGTDANAGCAILVTDTNDNNPRTCADTDQDGCDDCAVASWDPNDDGPDDDNDGVCNVGDICPNADDAADADGDGTPDGCDKCVGDDGSADTDGDGIPDNCDICPGGPDDVDLDEDGVPDACDICPAGDDAADADEDEVPDACDMCPGHDDATDTDQDGVADGCDICPGGNDTQDADGDSVPNACDICSAGDDNDDTDGDSVPDACDICPTGSDTEDRDSDGVADGCDTAPDNASICADNDVDGCDDCSRGPYDPLNDGDDIDQDGWCNVNDCDDTLPTCTDDCVTNSDSNESTAVVDCVEEYCGSDPDDATSICILVEGGELPGAITDARTSSEHEFILLGDVQVTGGLPNLDSSEGFTMTQRRGSALAVTATNSLLLFNIAGDNHVLDGLRIEGNALLQYVVEIRGANNTVQNSVIDHFRDRGIYMYGDTGTLVQGNVIRDGTTSASNEKGAIISRDSSDARIIDNVVVENASDGLQIRNADGIMIDNNTIAFNGRAGILLRHTASVDICLRNNNITHNATDGVSFFDDKAHTFDESPACSGPLSVDTTSGKRLYRNNVADNGASACTGTRCPDLDALGEWMLPTPVSPLYTSTTWPSPDFFCLGAQAIIDAGADLGHDLTSDPETMFGGAVPDIGAREAGADGCP